MSPRPAHRVQRPWLLAGLLGAALLGCPPGRAQDPAASEREIQAVWLLNFARYTDWPAAAFDSPSAPIVLGVAGRDPLGLLLEKTCSGKTVKGRSVVVKRWTAEHDPKPCHVLFVPASEGRRQRDWLGKVRGRPVLTVGESEDFLTGGGMLQFTLKDNTVRFSASLDAVQKGGLHLHASLLKVALSVQGRYE